MGDVLHLRPPSTPVRIAPSDQQRLIDGTLTATVKLNGAAAERVAVNAGMACKSVDQYMSDLVGWMVMLEPEGRR